MEPSAFEAVFVVDYKGHTALLYRWAGSLKWEIFKL